MNESYSDDVAEWSFPSLDIGINSTEAEETSNELQNNETQQEPVKTQNEQQIPLCQEQIASVIDSNAEQVKEAELLAKVELENIKADYEKKIEILNKTINKLEKLVDIFDHEIMDAIQEIIKKAVKKIISKEIETDPNLIADMIKELSELIQPKNNIISIQVSEADFKRLDLKDSKLADLVSIDNTFSTGDIAVKTNFTEVRAQLNDRIDQIMEEKND